MKELFGCLGKPPEGNNTQVRTKLDPKSYADRFQTQPSIIIFNFHTLTLNYECYTGINSHVTLTRINLTLSLLYSANISDRPM